MSSIIDWEELKENPSYEVARVCKIDTANLDEALQNHAAVYAYCNAQYEKARAEEGKLDWAYEQKKGEVFATLREEGTAIGEANETAELAPDVVEAKKKAMEAERKRRILWALVQGLEHRKAMLVQLSARQRAELNQ